MLGCIVSEFVGHDLEIVIKGVLEVYDSVVEGNGRFVILSNCFNFFNLFLFSTQKTTRDKTFRKRCSTCSEFDMQYRILTKTKMSQEMSSVPHS
jgi:hypothetical protein